MRLVSIKKDEISYDIIAESVYKIFGFTIYVKRREFIKCHYDIEWVEYNNVNNISKRKEQQLEKWLSDHKKFIERDEIKQGAITSIIRENFKSYKQHA